MTTNIKREYSCDEDSGTEMTITTEATLANTVIAIGYLIRYYFNELPKEARPLFKGGIQHLVTDDSPVWKRPNNVMTIDMTALQNMGGRQRDES